MANSVADYSMFMPLIVFNSHPRKTPEFVLCAPYAREGTKPWSTGALWEETDILTKKPAGQFHCLYHVGTRLGDLENAIRALKSVVPYRDSLKGLYVVARMLQAS